MKHGFKYTKIGDMEIMNNVTITDPFITISAWYDKNGNRIGLGELSLKDLKLISENLKYDELFIIVNIDDSFWCFISGKKPERNLDLDENVSKDFLYNNSIIIIAKNKMYIVDYLNRENATTNIYIRKGFVVNKNFYDFKILPANSLPNLF